MATKKKTATRKKQATKKKAAKKKTPQQKAAAKYKANKREQHQQMLDHLPELPSHDLMAYHAGAQNTAGRPTKYDKDYHPAVAERLCIVMYATNQQLADYFKVAIDTIYQWLNKYPEFSDAIKRGKSYADDTIEQALFHRAAGYQHEDSHISTYYGQVIITPIVKHYPPDPTAQIFWLTNRRRGDWKRNIDVHDSGDDVPPLTINFEVREAVSDVKVTRGK